MSTFKIKRSHFMVCPLCLRTEEFFPGDVKWCEGGFAEAPAHQMARMQAETVIESVTKAVKGMRK